jgi:predicted metalloprotease with PDZ domain
MACPAMADLLQADHRISFSDRQNQYVDLRLRLPVESGEVELIMPAWTPGSYLIRDYSANVERLRASGAGNRPLPVRKVSKNRWLVQCPGEHEINVTYSVWAGELKVNSNWVESEFAQLNGAGIFLFSPASRYWPQTVSVELPPDWSRVFTALPRAPDGQRFLARDYDELVDSPMLFGNGKEYRFTVSGHEYVLVNQGETKLWDGPKSAEDVAAIVTSVQDFWEINPFERPYWFLNVIAQGAGGLEHDYSTVLLTDSWQMRFREDYLRWLSTVAHEFFHAWNVRRLRPAALKTVDYDREVYTRELWLAEGLTSYYDNLLLLRSGLISVEEYFELLAAEFLAYETTPGRHVRSAESASFDAWIKYYKPNANSPNSAVSYYRKGTLIGFVADMRIRRQTGNQSSLDTLMRALYRKYGPQGSEGNGYPPHAFEAEVESLAGNEIRDQVSAIVSTTRDPDIDEALEWYGLALDRAPSRATAIEAGRPVPVDFGLTWNKKSPVLEVETVLQGGSGARAGVLPADELIAIDGYRVTRDTLSDRMQRLVPSETAELLLVRHGRVITLAVEVQEAVPDKYQITMDPEINRKQKERMSAWLGVALKFETP